MEKSFGQEAKVKDGGWQIAQAMESSVVIKNGGRQPACVWWAPYFLRAVLTFLLCTDQDAGWTSLLPPLQISLFLLGPFS